MVIKIFSNAETYFIFKKIIFIQLILSWRKKGFTGEIFLEINFALNVVVFRPSLIELFLLVLHYLTVYANAINMGYSITCVCHVIVALNWRSLNYEYTVITEIL